MQYGGGHRGQDVVVGGNFHVFSVGLDNELSVGFRVAWCEKWGAFFLFVVHFGEAFVLRGGSLDSPFVAPAYNLVGGAGDGVGASALSSYLPSVFAGAELRRFGIVAMLWTRPLIVAAWANTSLDRASRRWWAMDRDQVRAAVFLVIYQIRSWTSLLMFGMRSRMYESWKGKVAPAVAGTVFRITVGSGLGGEGRRAQRFP